MTLALTPTRFLRRAALAYGGKTAVVGHGRRLTYRELAEGSARLAAGLRRLGIAPGDRVVYLGPSAPDYFELAYATLSVGAVLCPLNVRLAAEELGRQIEELKPRLAVRALPPDAAAVAALAGRVPFVAALGDPLPGELAYAALPVPPPAPPLADWPADGDVAQIFYTSGTTASPKGVMLSHRSLYAHALQVIAATHLGEDTVEVVGCVPFFHVNGWGAVHYLVALGARAVVLPRFEPEAFGRAVAAERATFAVMVPTMLRDLLEVGVHLHHDLSSLAHVLVGGAPAPEALIRRAREELRCDVRVGYGLTEAGPVVAIAPETPEDSARLASAGVPVPGVEVALVDEAGRFLPHDGRSVGELVVRGDTVFLGYWQAAEATRAAFLGEWLRTGDLAVVDDGVVRLVGRAKEVIVSGGENVGAAEVEAVLLDHPAVRDCAVVGIPHERWGEVPYAFVVPRPGGTVAAEELLAFVRPRLAPFKVPAGVRFVEELPRTATGKVRRQELTRLLLPPPGSPATPPLPTGEASGNGDA